MTMLRIGLAVALGVLAPACDDNPTSPSGTWRCTVTLTLVPSRVGSRSSPSGTATGTGTGATASAATSAALSQACQGLDLDAATEQACKAGQDFQVEGGSSGNLRLFSAVDRSTSCNR